MRPTRHSGDSRKFFDWLEIAAGDLLAARAKGLRKAELLNGHAAAHAHGIRCGDGGEEIGFRLLAGRKDLCGVADFFQAFLEFVESFHGQPS